MLLYRWDPSISMVGLHRGFNLLFTGKPQNQLPSLGQRNKRMVLLNALVVDNRCGEVRVNSRHDQLDFCSRPVSILAGFQLSY